MKNESSQFEKDLSRQPIRDIPPHWRNQILREARDASETHCWWRNWRELIWPYPQAWLGVAAVWVIILLLQFQTSGTGSVQMMASDSAQPANRFAEHRQILSQLCEGLPAQVAHLPRKYVPGPGSLRHLIIATA